MMVEVTNVNSRFKKFNVNVFCVCVQLRLLPQDIGHLALQEAATVYMCPQCSSISMVAYLIIFGVNGP